MEPRISANKRASSRELIVPIESARVRQHPHRRVGQALRLQAELGVGPGERGTGCRHAEDGDDTRSMPALDVPKHSVPALGIRSHIMRVGEQ